PLPTLVEPGQTEEPSVYRARRDALMKEIGEGVAVIFAKGHEDGDGFRQSSDFFFLTGVNEPDAVLVLAPKERTYREFLLLPSRDPEAERWTGERDPIGSALRKKHGFDKIFRTSRLAGLVVDLAARSPVLWQVSLAEAEAERVWKSRGARRPAYPSIVGSGPNSTILHYPRSERVMQDGELILMDMSAEFAHYAADITRTLPVNGKFTALQRRIYDLVLKAQKAAFAQVRPGAYFEDLDAVARKVIVDAGYGDYFIHGLGHFVGLDVHDAGAYQEPLAPGMVITLEPGIYLPDEKFGVRIEDDVLVTKAGAKFLSDGLPREAADIERWMATRSAVAVRR